MLVLSLPQHLRSQVWGDKAVACPSKDALRLGGLHIWTTQTLP